MASDLEIARAAQLEPIESIAWKLGIPSGELLPHGQYMANTRSMHAQHTVYTR